MSSLLYGHITRKRQATQAPRSLRVGGTIGPLVDAPHTVNLTQEIRDLPDYVRNSLPDLPADAEVLAVEPAEDEQDAKDVGRWVDVVAALVPAEVLALHAFALSLFATTKTVNDEAIVTIEQTGIVSWLFVVFVLLSALLVLLGSGFAGLTNWVRAALVALAFVAWTMLQQGTAFDAVLTEVSKELNPDLRLVIGAIAAAVIAAVVAQLAKVADKEPAN